MVKMSPSFNLPYLSTWDHVGHPTSLSPPVCKKMRTTIDEAFTSAEGGEDDSGQPDGYRKLRFRDHIWSFKQKIRALEAAEEPPAEDSDTTAAADNNREEAGDGMRLVQLLISCAEAVACRDRAQATALLLELKSSALTLGTSFQRVASCFVQGLDRT